MTAITSAIFDASFTALPLAAPAAPSAGGAFIQNLLLFVPLILIFYFLIIRPQQQRAKQHREMVENIRRGDTVITTGGLIAKVTKVAEQELTIELADGVRARLVKGMIADVRGKGQLVPANDSKPS
ncbi:MAG: preprotein translocase subunit YajC [Pseudomonadota bacterium]